MTLKIYKITCKINGKLYIGQTRKTLKQRLKSHEYSSRSEYGCESQIITRAIRKHGIKNFEIELLKEFKYIDQATLNKIETYYIYKHDSLYPKGYNISKGGGVINSVRFLRAPKIKIKNYSDEEFLEWTVNKGKRPEAFVSKQGRESFVQSHKKLWKENLEFREKITKILRNNSIEQVRRRKECSVSAWKFSISNTTRYLLTKPCGSQFCTYGLVHLKDDFGLDCSQLVKLAKNKVKYYKGWKCEYINKEDINGTNKINFQNLKKYLIISPNGLSFCNYGLSNLEDFGINAAHAGQVALGHRNHTGGWQIYPLDEQSSINNKEYLPDYNRYHVIPPNNAPEFCTYGLKIIEEVYNLSAVSLSYYVKNKLHLKGKTHKGWQFILIVEKHYAAKGKTKSKKNTNYFEIESPDGIKFCVFDLSEFCKNNNLSRTNMLSVSSGVRTQHKGYKCKEIET